MPENVHNFYAASINRKVFESLHPKYRDRIDNLLLKELIEDTLEVPAVAQRLRKW